MYIRCKNCGYVENIRNIRGIRIKELYCPSCNKNNVFKRLKLKSDEFNAYLFYNKPSKLTDDMIKEFLNKYKEEFHLKQAKEELKSFKQDLINILKDEKILNEFKKENSNIEKEIKDDIEKVNVLLKKEKNSDEIYQELDKLEEKYKKYESWDYVFFL